MHERFEIIVVLDSFYPFSVGETFLENEFPHMKKYTKKIIFLPLRGRTYTSSRIMCKDDIVAVQGLRESWWTRGFTDLRALFRKDFWKEHRKSPKERDAVFTTIRIMDYNAQFYRLREKIRYILKRHIKNAEARILFYAYWMGMCAHLASSLKMEYRNAVAISRAHGGDIYGERQKLGFLPYRKEGAQNIDAIFPVSDKGTRYLINEFPELEGRISCSRLGTKDWGRNFPDVEMPFTVISCSSMIPLKRIHLLIEALALCNREFRWIHFGDGELRKELGKQAQGLPESVQWEFRGQISNAVLMQTYREMSIDMFINVSSTEGIPVSIMEALSFGIPVMATDVGGTKEAVFDGYNGKLLPADITPADLAQAIMDFREELENSGERYRNNARQSWEKSYSAEKNYTDFYEKVSALHMEICGKRNSGA